MHSRKFPRATHHKVSGALLGVSEPLLAFGTDTLKYYRAPAGTLGIPHTASSDRLIQCIDATAARFTPLYDCCPSDQLYSWIRRANTKGIVPLKPEQARISARLAILDIPGSRLIMMSMLMAANMYSKKLFQLMAFENPYTVFQISLRANNVFEWFLPKLEKTGVDLDRFFKDMLELKPSHLLGDGLATRRP